MEREEIQSDPALHQKLTKQLDYAMMHTSEATTARKLVFTSYLGASIKNAAQNLLQLPLNAIPEAMHQGAGFHAYTDLLEAGRLSLKWVKEGTTGNKDFDVLMKQAETDGSVIPSLVDAYAPASGDIQNALDTITRQGKGNSWVGQQVGTQLSKFGQNFNNLMRSLSVSSEAVNRRASFFMSLLNSQRKGQKDLRAMYNDAKQFTDFSNFVGSKANRPGYQVSLGQSPWAHSAVLAATAMQSFFFNHVSQIAAYARQASKGDKQAKVALAAGVGHLAVFGGILGLVGASTMEQLLEEVSTWMGHPVSVRKTFRKEVINAMKETFNWDDSSGGRLADTALYGLPAAVGIDTGGSVGLGDPILQYRAGEDISALDLAGPAGSLLQRTGETVGQVKSAFETGNWEGAARQVPFKAWNHLVKIYDAITASDYKTQQGMPLVQNLDGSSSMAVALGFTPRQVTIQRDMQTQVRKGELLRSDELLKANTEIARLLVSAKQSGDPEAIASAQETFEEYVNSTANTANRESMVSSISQIMQRMTRPVTRAPSATGQQGFQEAEETYPEAEVHYADRLPAVFDELEIAQLLDQPDVLVKKLSGLKQAVQHSALTDSLIQEGYYPAQASALSSRNIESLLRTNQ
jgi:hypothetical protein